MHLWFFFLAIKRIDLCKNTFIVNFLQNFFCMFVGVCMLWPPCFSGIVSVFVLCICLLSFVFLFCLLSVFACYCRPVSVPISRLLQNTDLIANSIPAFVSKSFFYNFYQKDNFYQNTFQREAYLEHEMNDSASYWILDHTCNVCTFQMSIPQIRFSCTSFYEVQSQKQREWSFCIFHEFGGDRLNIWMGSISRDKLSISKTDITQYSPYKSGFQEGGEIY